ncbi:MAG: dihydrofolate reductase [Erysipelotrichaceae bacterium]|jgi:dihydrofolate reductase|nr:dihydrofolate reductase [Erysipelotrichaceae bacterium]
MRKLISIAAIGKNAELGFQNALIWSLKGDMTFFKQTTRGHTVVMGLNTYRSIGKALPHRENIVLSFEAISLNDAKVFTSFDNLLKYLKTLNDEIYICGGASIYHLFMPLVDEMLLTRINATTTQVDTYFPAFNPEDFTTTILETGIEQGIEYQIIRYQRKK